jgi:hypothetical protein
MLSKVSRSKIAFNIRYLLDVLNGKTGIITFSRYTDTGPAVFEYQKLPKVLIMPMQVSWPGDTPPPASAEPTDETSNTETTEEPESSGEEETSETETIEEAYTFVFKGLDIRKATYAELQNAFLNTYQMEDVVCRRCIKLFTELSADAGIPLSLQLEHR